MLRAALLIAVVAFIVLSLAAAAVEKAKTAFDHFMHGSPANLAELRPEFENLVSQQARLRAILDERRAKAGESQ